MTIKDQYVWNINCCYCGRDDDSPDNPLGLVSCSPGNWYLHNNCRDGFDDRMRRRHGGIGLLRVTTMKTAYQTGFDDGYAHFPQMSPPSSTDGDYVDGFWDGWSVANRHTEPDFCECPICGQEARQCGCHYSGPVAGFHFPVGRRGP